MYFLSCLFVNYFFLYQTYHDCRNIYGIAIHVAKYFCLLSEFRLFFEWQMQKFDLIKFNSTEQARRKGLKEQSLIDDGRSLFNRQIVATRFFFRYLYVYDWHREERRYRVPNGITVIGCNRKVRRRELSMVVAN